MVRLSERMTEMRGTLEIAFVSAGVVALGSAATAVDIETVTMGNPGNVNRTT